MATKRTVTFPQPIGDTSGWLCAPDPGMDLRDWFAGKALAGGLREYYAAGDTWNNYDDFARSCYNIADAMIRAREGR